MIRWTDQARADLNGQLNWLHERNPRAAAEVAEDVLTAIGQLVMFPNSGRLGRRHGTRELVTAPRPFVVVYKVTEPEIVILRVLHGSQLWLA